MKKFFQAMRKNLKILFRFKTSLAAMILGPLIVIFLISFAFNSSSQFQINIGYVAQENSTLTENFITSLNEEYRLTRFESISDCVWELKQSLQHVCMGFPKDFVIRAQKENNITFYVDETRINIVYAVLASVSEQIGLQEDQLSQGLTQNLIDTLDESSTNIDSTLSQIIVLKKNIADVRSDISSTQGEIKDISLTDKSIDTNLVDEVNEVDTTVKHLRNAATRAVTNIEPVVVNMKASETNGSRVIQLDQILEEVDALNESATEKYNDSQTAIASLTSALNSLANAVEDLEEQVSTAKTNIGEASEGLETSKSDLEATEKQVETIKQNLEQANQRIGQVEITSSAQIVNPIQTEIKTVVSDQNQLLILFPYVLLLIIMFGGLMLSSTLVVLEKRSKAFFRVFTTPTRSQFYIWTSFFTCFGILIAQIIVIYVLMKFFFIDLLSVQVVNNALVLGIACALFTFLGMGIGYLMRNQQGANMISISIGAILLFLSNIVLPLETVAPYLQRLANYNPFVIASDILRRSIIFETPLSEMSTEFILLASYVVIIFILITVSHDFAKNRFMQRLTKKSKRKVKKKGIKIKDELISSEKELIKKVTNLEEKEFNVLARSNNKFRAFIREEISEPLGQRMRKLSKSQFLHAIQEKNREIIQYLEERKPLPKHKKEKKASKKKKDSKK